MDSLNPSTMVRRSFIYRDLMKAGAEFGEVNQGAVALRYGKVDEVSAAQKLGLADLSVLPHTGFKGRGTVEWLTSQGLEIGPDSNRAYRQKNGELALRLAPTEILLIDALAGTGALIDQLNQAWQWAEAAPRPQMGYPMPRQDSHAWFVVSGLCAPEMFSKICGVDLRPAKFSDGEIAQTSAAKMSAVITRSDLQDVVAFHVLADIASAEYLWSCLVDAMTEFDGQLVGLEALRKLA